jgi:hypothetical protein
VEKDDVYAVRWEKMDEAIYACYKVDWDFIKIKINASEEHCQLYGKRKFFILCHGIKSISPPENHVGFILFYKTILRFSLQPI